MQNIVRIDFKERDQQWLVTLWYADGTTRPGEPFPASEAENYSKAEQIAARLKLLGLKPKQWPDSGPNERWYRLDVVPLEE